MTDVLEVARIGEALRLIGTDNYTLRFDKDAKVHVCQVGWKVISLAGYGYTEQTAMLDAYNKIRVEVAEQYSIILPDVLNGELPE